MVYVAKATKWLTDGVTGKTAKNTSKCRHDYTNFIRAGRSVFLCPKCRKDITIDVIWLAKLKDPEKTTQGEKMIEIKCARCGEAYTIQDVTAVHGKVSIIIRPCQNCFSYVDNMSEKAGRLKEQKRIGKYFCNGFGDHDGCDAVNYDGCAFNEACLEYTDGNLPDENTLMSMPSRK